MKNSALSFARKGGVVRKFAFAPLNWRHNAAGHNPPATSIATHIGLHPRNVYRQLLPPPVSWLLIVSNFLADEMADKSGSGEPGHYEEIGLRPRGRIAAEILHHNKNHQQACR